jgi:hypothetical protein
MMASDRQRKTAVIAHSLRFAVALVMLLATSGQGVAGDRPTRTPMPDKDHNRATRTPIDLGDRTRKPTDRPTATRTALPSDVRTRKPSEPPTATRTPLVLDQRYPTKTPRATRTPKLAEPNPRPEDRATRTPVTEEERTRKPEKELRPTRTPVVIEARATKAPRPTRTPKILEGRTAKPTAPLRPTRTPFVAEERPGKPTKTARATRTAMVKEERTEKPPAELRPTRTPKPSDDRERPPTKTARPTRTAKLAEARTEVPGGGARPTRTGIPTKTATPVPQFNAANVVASCSAVLKKNVTIVFRVTNNSGADILNVAAGSLGVDSSGGTFRLGPAPANFTRLPNGQTAVFRWRGEFESENGACGFTATASARGPHGEAINIPATDCGTVTLGHGGESDLLPACGGGSGEGGAAGCGDSGPGPTPGAGGGLPDLTVDGGALSSSVIIENRTFPSNSCAIVEGCVGGSGNRRLLRFSTVTPNIGNADVYLGDPRSSGNFIYSSCHDHYHFNGYAEYRLFGSGGERRGRKQAFCLIDLDPIREGTDGPKYTCLNQGITAGWADIYDRYLDCQWIDITGLAPGTYTLEVSINPSQRIPESNYSNNVVRTTVNIPPQ